MIIEKKDLEIGEYYYEKNNCGEIFISHYKSSTRMDFIRVDENGKANHLTINNGISWVLTATMRRLATYQEIKALQLCVAKGGYDGVTVLQKGRVYEIY